MLAPNAPYDVISSDQVEGTKVYNAQGDKLGSMLTYDTSRDGYVVPLDKAVLERAPHYAESDAPAYTDEYDRKVHDYYGTSWY